MSLQFVAHSSVMIQRTLTLPLLALFALVALSSCTAARSSSINHHIDATFAEMNDSAYRSSLKEISAACKLDYNSSDRSDENGDRPLAIHALDDGSLVLSLIADTLQLSNVSSSGKHLWTLDTGLTSAQFTASGDLIAYSGLGKTCLSLQVDLGPIRNLVYACAQKNCQVIRVADANGTYCARFLSEQLPDFKYSKAKCESSTGADSFAALIRLSQISAGKERSSDAVRSQLEAFSSGTNAWLAEAAASVLIMALE